MVLRRGRGWGGCESQSSDEQLICVRLCKVVQSFRILHSIQCQFTGVPLSVSGICYNALSERQSKSSNNLQRAHKDLLHYHPQRRYLGCKILTAWTKKSDKKNAFQWDAYRPLVDRIPTCSGGCTCPGRVYLLRGVYLPGGVPAQGGCTYQGVYLPGGCTCPGGHLPKGSTCPGTPPCGQTNTCKNITYAKFVCGR